MPKIDKMTVLAIDGQSQDTFACLNLHWSVGLNGDNGPADVMLVQALFRYIAHDRHSAGKYFGLPLNRIPQISTKMDSATKMAILAFQRTNSKRVLKIDGTIEPAKYEGRVIKNTKGRVMTITLLEMFAKLRAFDNSDMDHINGVIKLEPRLAPWLV